MKEILFYNNKFWILFLERREKNIKIKTIKKNNKIKIFKCDNCFGFDYH